MDNWQRDAGCPLTHSSYCNDCRGVVPFSTVKRFPFRLTNVEWRLTGHEAVCGAVSSEVGLPGEEVDALRSSEPRGKATDMRADKGAHGVALVWVTVLYAEGLSGARRALAAVCACHASVHRDQRLPLDRAA